MKDVVEMKLYAPTSVRWKDAYHFFCRVPHNQKASDIFEFMLKDVLAVLEVRSNFGNIHLRVFI